MSGSMPGAEDIKPSQLVVDSTSKIVRENGSILGTQSGQRIVGSSESYLTDVTENQD